MQHNLKVDQNMAAIKDNERRLCFSRYYWSTFPKNITPHTTQWNRDL